MNQTAELTLALKAGRWQMRRFLRLAQIAALMAAGCYVTLLIVVAIVQPRPVDTLQDNRSAITASQLQAEASLLSATPR